MKTVIWKLKPGTKENQESREQKKQAAYDYIDKLNTEGEEIVNVIEEDDSIKIYINE